MNPMKAFPVLAPVLALVLVLLAQAVAGAREVTFAWDPNPEPDIAGYRLFIHREGTGWEVLRTLPGTGTETTVPDFPEEAAWVHLTALNSAGLESLPSEFLLVPKRPILPEAAPPGAPGGLEELALRIESSPDLETWTEVAVYGAPAARRMFYRMEFATP